ncbi:MAG: hypothetical protein K6B40_07250 [Firmicutes bacterium]|nr:hypothetical protein [Bacillota bacterium]
MKKLYLCLALAIICLLLPGCGRGLNPAASQIYENAAGYQITLPDTWQILQENDTETVFAGPDGNITLTLSNDLGGVEYYSLEEINEMLAKNIAEALFSSYAVEKSQSGDIQCRQSYVCHKEDGQGYMLDILVYRQDPAIKYYAVFCLPLQMYRGEKPLIDDVFASFEQTKDAETLYALTQQRNEAAWAAEAEKMKAENGEGGDPQGDGSENANPENTNPENANPEGGDNR